MRGEGYQVVVQAVRGIGCRLVGMALCGMAMAGCVPVAGDDMAAGSEVAPAPRSAPDEPQAHCADWTELTDSGLIYQNNVWGKGDLVDYEQCLLTRTVDGMVEYGWRWQWPAGSGRVKAYPEVIYGHKPWNKASTTPFLPARLASIRKLSIAYAVELSAQGAYNLAYDIWVTGSVPPAPDTITHEVMIWLAGTFEAQPRRFLAGRVMVDGATYDLYLHPEFHGESGADYIAFVSREARLQGTIDVRRFLDYLVEHDHVPGDHYVAAVELGSEVVDGAGELWLQRFEVTVE